jgi:hypothetical protein
MKASHFSDRFHPGPHDERPGSAQRARHVLGVIAALSLLVVSTAVWAEPGLGHGADPSSALPTASAEVPAVSPWHAPGAAPRASLEVDTRQPTAPWDDQASWRLRYVRWAPAGGGALGLSMGVGGTQPVNAALPPALRDPRAPTSLAPELGVRWRSSWAANRRVDVGAFGSYDDSAALPVAERRSYNARVELQFRENRSKFGFDSGNKALGLQLSGASRVMLRARHGGPMVYYRSTW